MVNNLPSSAGDAGSIPGWGTEIPHAVGQLSPHATTRVPVLKLLRLPAVESVLRNQRGPCAVTKTQGSQKRKKPTE